MKKTRHIPKLAAILMLILLCMSVFCTTAFALEESDPIVPVLTDVVDDETVDPAENIEQGAETPDGESVDEPLQESESAIPIGSGFRPFTPPGTGTVVDNAIDGDGKEFYTIMTEAGDVFYLIIDRQRNTQNVYFLNAVTEDDLMALAVKNGRTINGGTSEIPPTDQPGTNGQDSPATPTPGTEKPGGNNVMLIVIIIAAAGVGVAVYYFKVIKGKKNTPEDDYEDDDSGDEYGYDDETEENDDDFANGGDSE